MSFGTKLLYFAGYTTAHRPRPLILDENVRWSLSLPQIAPGLVPQRAVVREPHYLNYLERAEIWSSDPSWDQEPHVVEYGLFSMNGRLPDG